MKTKHLSIIIGSTIILLLIIFQSCYDYGGSSGEFTIKIDRITIPQTTLHSYDTLKVAFWADVTKTNSSGHFKRFDISQKPDSAIITAVGYWCVGPRGLPPDCATGEQILNGYICRVYPVTQGFYTIIVNQPDGSTIIKQVYIE